MNEHQDDELVFDPNAIMRMLLNFQKELHEDQVVQHGSDDTAITPLENHYSETFASIALMLAAGGFIEAEPDGSLDLKRWMDEH